MYSKSVDKGYDSSPYSTLQWQPNMDLAPTQNGAMSQLDHPATVSRKKQFQFATAHQLTIYSLLDILRHPLDAFPVAHLSHYTAHKHLNWPHVGLPKIHLTLASGVVAQA